MSRSQMCNDDKNNPLDNPFPLLLMDEFKYTCAKSKQAFPWNIQNNIAKGDMERLPVDKRTMS